VIKRVFGNPVSYVNKWLYTTPAAPWLLTPLYSIIEVDLIMYGY